MARISVVLTSLLRLHAVSAAAAALALALVLTAGAGATVLITVITRALVLVLEAVVVLAVFATTASSLATLRVHVLMAPTASNVVSLATSLVSAHLQRALSLEAPFPLPLLHLQRVVHLAPAPGARLVAVLPLAVLLVRVLIPAALLAVLLARPRGRMVNLLSLLRLFLSPSLLRIRKKSLLPMMQQLLLSNEVS